VDRSAGVSDNPGIHEHRHRWRNLCAVGRLPQPSCAERNDFGGVTGYLPLATDHDAVLLLKNYLRTNTQGKPVTVHQRAAMQQLSAKVFKLSFEYLHIYSPKSGDFCRKKIAKLRY